MRSHPSTMLFYVINLSMCGIKVLHCNVYISMCALFVNASPVTTTSTPKGSIHIEGKQTHPFVAITELQITQNLSQSKFTSKHMLCMIRIEQTLGTSVIVKLLKLQFSQYSSIHTNYIIHHCTTLQYNHNI